MERKWMEKEPKKEERRVGLSPKHSKNSEAVLRVPTQKGAGYVTSTVVIRSLMHMERCLVGGKKQIWKGYFFPAEILQRTNIRFYPDTGGTVSLIGKAQDVTPSITVAKPTLTHGLRMSGCSVNPKKIKNRTRISKRGLHGTGVLPSSKIKGTNTWRGPLINGAQRTLDRINGEEKI
ncbi:hypothetical protein STEG23_020122 [Scotinomys teguina]